MRASAVVMATALTAACGGGDGAPDASPSASASATASVAPVADPAQRTGSLGSLTFPNSGAAAAQDDFLRGVAWLHSFGYEDAIDAFRAAQAKDPGLRDGLLGRGDGLQPAALVLRGTRQGPRGAGAAGIDAPRRGSAKAGTARERGFLRAVEALWGPVSGRCGPRRSPTRWPRSRPPIRVTTRRRCSMRWPCSARCRAATRRCRCARRRARWPRRCSPATRSILVPRT